ncbi:MAG: hypothetical protein MI700_08760 [Balneolales bacterium]|nr:hypothetical protein [Balneolales bacterium]
MKAEEINKKIEISWAAVDIYLNKGRISIPDLVEKTKLSATEIYSCFPNKKAILAYYYPSLVFQYWAMIDEIDDFDSYSISEKFSNFIYTSFDMMSEKMEFVSDTFKKYGFDTWTGSEYHEEVTTLFKDFLNNDADIAVSAAFFMNDFYYKTLATQYLFLVNFWLNDHSENKERTLALADKSASLFEEIVYNKTVDKTFDLFKFVFGSTSFENPFSKLEDCWNWSESKEKQGDSNEETEGEDKDE